MNRLSRSCLATAAAHTTAHRVGVPIQIINGAEPRFSAAEIKLDEIEALRKLNAVSVLNLCVSAGVSPATYHRMRRRPDKARPATINRLVHALRSMGAVDQSNALPALYIPGGPSGPDERTETVSHVSGHSLTANGVNGIRIGLLERFRINNFVTVTSLCATAGVSVKTYERIRRNPEQARSVTIDRLADALKKLRSGNRLDPADRLVRIEFVYGGFLAQVAPFFGVTPDQVRAQNPRAATTADKAWSTVAHARQAAVYLTHTVGGVPQRAIARAIGLTEAAVCKAIQSIEDRRDDPNLDRMIDAAAKAVAGRVA